MGKTTLRIQAPSNVSFDEERTGIALMLIGPENANQKRAEPLLPKKGKFAKARLAGVS
jgi:hypothetical protein